MKIIHLAMIDSTQKHARLLLDEGYQEDFCVLADNQSDAIGTRGRKWVSQEGGIYFTVLRRLDFNLLKQNFDVSEFCSDFTLGLAAAIKDHLVSLGFDGLRVKPINDIYFADSKLAGILTESVNSGEDSCLLIGLGLNFCSLDIQNLELEHQPISLEEIKADLVKTVDRVELASALAKLVASQPAKLSKI